MADPSNFGNSDFSSPIDRFLEGSSMSVPPNDPQQSPESQHPSPPEPIEIGNPQGADSTWDGQQSYPDTCAIRSQEYILEVMTGQEFDEDQLVQEALEKDWYTPGMGTPVEHVGKLLEHHGVPVNRYENASIFHLANELSQGHQVIVGVDASELQKNPILDGLLSEALDKLGLSGANHAVVVTGIETTESGDTFVVIADPGTGEPAARYPLEQFLYAWQDSNCFLVATAETAPPEAPGMENFDYETGHLAEIADIDWDTFLPILEKLAHVGLFLLFAYLKDHLIDTEVAEPLVDPPSPEDLTLLPDGALDQLQEHNWATQLLGDWGWMEPPHTVITTTGVEPEEDTNFGSDDPHGAEGMDLDDLGDSHLD